MLNKKGFTLIELLVVIGVLAVLMAGVVALIDPIDKNRAANDAQMQSLVANAATAEESYAATHNGCYARTWAALNTAGELKQATPAFPATGGYAAPTFTIGGVATCTLATETDSINICANLKSKRYTGPATANWHYDSASGKTCATTNCADACP
jgi:prepilin-type N-terminal cleavage/methylation domain-containing protein